MMRRIKQEAKEESEVVTNLERDMETTKDPLTITMTIEPLTEEEQTTTKGEKTEEIEDPKESTEVKVIDCLLID